MMFHVFITFNFLYNTLLAKCDIWRRLSEVGDKVSELNHFGLSDW